VGWGPPAYALADRVAAASPAAVRATVALLRQTRHAEPFARALAAEATVQGRVCVEGDLALGLDALVGRREPAYPDYDAGARSRRPARL
jgi:enoyl-CoA hydratase/carnithine racemase